MKTLSHARPIVWIGLLLGILSLTALGCLSPTLITTTPTAEQPVQISTATPSPEPLAQPVLVGGGSDEELLIALYQRANPAVVHIRIYTQGALLGSGSGFVVDNQRHIVTNNHVVQDAEEMEIVFWDATRVRGEVIGFDRDADLAVILADSMPEGIVPLELGDSDLVQVGQRVIAIGNPFGLQGTLTVGVVSGLKRRLESQREQDLTAGTYSNPDIIQTDAAINPGNSGGPLLDSAGRVIGINTAIRSLSGSNSGVGFAAPVNTINKLLPSLIEQGYYVYPWMGISGLQEIDLHIMEQLDLSQTKGVYVTNVTAGGPADRAGIRADSSGSAGGGDLIVAIDDYQLIDFGDLVSYLVAKTEPGQEVQLTVLRNGDTLQIPLVLGERP